MAKTRSRGMITLTDESTLIFTSAFPVWLTRLMFRTSFIKPVGKCDEGHRHAIDRERIANVIVTHENPRRR